MREAGNASANTISVGISNVRAKYNEAWALCIKWIYKPVLSLEMGNEKREPNTKRRFGCDKRATRNSAHQSKVDNDDVGYLTFSSSSCITQYAVARCGFNWMHARRKLQLYQRHIKKYVYICPLFIWHFSLCAVRAHCLSFWSLYLSHSINVTSMLRPKMLMRLYTHYMPICGLISAFVRIWYVNCSHITQLIQNVIESELNMGLNQSTWWTCTSTHTHWHITII